jgi:hypothetical protein
MLEMSEELRSRAFNYTDISELTGIEGSGGFTFYTDEQDYEVICEGFETLDELKYMRPELFI